MYSNSLNLALSKARKGPEIVGPKHDVYPAASLYSSNSRQEKMTTRAIYRIDQQPGKREGLKEVGVGKVKSRKVKLDLWKDALHRGSFVKCLKPSLIV